MPSGNRWPLGWRVTANRLPRGPQRQRPAGAPFESRTPASLLPPQDPSTRAAPPTPLGAPRRRVTPPTPGGTPQRRRGRVGPRAPRGDRSPQAGRRPINTRSTLPSVTITGGMPVMTSRCRRTGVNSPCPSERWRIAESGGPRPPLSVPSWVGRPPCVARRRSTVFSCVQGPGVVGWVAFLVGEVWGYPVLGVSFLITFVVP